MIKPLLLLLVTAFVGCSVEQTAKDETPALPSATAAPSVGELRGEVAEFQELWMARAIRDYDMTVSYRPGGQLEPALAVNVRVRDGSVVSVEPADPTDKRGRLSFYDPYLTVDRMFARLAELRTKPGRLEVKFNKEYGYPAAIDYAEPNPDAFFKMRVTSFRIIDETQRNGDSRN